MKAIDKILNEGKGNQYENLCLLSEVKLNRIVDALFKLCFIILSGFRDDKTSSENKRAAKQLLQDIITSNHTFLPLFIGINEKEGAVHEVCFLIPNKKEEHADLIKLGKQLAIKYNQELFLFKVSGDSFYCQFLKRSGEVESSFTSSNLNEIVQIYFKKISDKALTDVYVKQGAQTINEHRARALRGELQIIEYGS